MQTDVLDFYLGQVSELSLNKKTVLFCSYIKSFQ